MKKSIWIVLLLTFALLLSACQATPDKPVVVNKGDNSLNQKIANEYTENTPGYSYLTINAIDGSVQGILKSIIGGG